MMKIAIVIHGNLRTFLMPLREAPHIRLCDLTLHNIFYENQNDSDVFIATDCNDFYYNGSQYFCDDKKIEIINSDSFRLFPNIKFESKNNCRQIITTQLLSLIPNIKKLYIEDPVDCADDEKCAVLKEAFKQGFHGAPPSQLVAQYKKLKTLGNMVNEYENENNIKYDVILKIRFDAFYPCNRKLNLKSYSYDDSSVYVPNCEGNMIYDWIAFGSRNVLMPYLNLYDKIGFTTEHPCWLVEHCPKCGKQGFYGKIPVKMGWHDTCPVCQSSGKIWVGDLTLASEYHVFQMYKMMNVTPKPCNYYPIIYRYQDLQNNVSLENIFKNNELSGVKFVNNFENEKTLTVL